MGKIILSLDDYDWTLTSERQVPTRREKQDDPSRQLEMMVVEGEREEEKTMGKSGHRLPNVGAK